MSTANSDVSASLHDHRLPMPVPAGEYDRCPVTDLLRRQAEETGSRVAAELLADPAATRARFTRVRPTEYSRVRAALAKAEADGLDPSAPGVWEGILEVARG